MKGLCNKCDRAITCLFCPDLHLTLLCSSFIQKFCVKEAEVFQTITVTQGLAVFFPLLYFCVILLLRDWCLCTKLLINYGIFKAFCGFFVH